MGNFPTALGILALRDYLGLVNCALFLLTSAFTALRMLFPDKISFLFLRVDCAAVGCVAESGLAHRTNDAVARVGLK